MNKELQNEVHDLLQECEKGIFFRTMCTPQIRRDALDYALAQGWIRAYAYKNSFSLTEEGYEYLEELVPKEESKTSKFKQFINRIFKKK